jgi:hypothetical protein
MYDLLKTTGIFDDPGSENETQPNRPVNASSESPVFLSEIDGFIKCFDALNTALLVIRKPGLNQRCFSIPVQDPDRRLVCNIIPFTMESIDAMYDCLKNVLHNKSGSEDVSTQTASFKCLREMCSAVLGHLQLRGSEMVGVDGKDIFETMTLVRTLLQVLSVS